MLKEIFSRERWFHSRSLLFWSRAKFDYLILEQAIQKLVLHHAPKFAGSPKSFNLGSDENQRRMIVVVFRKQRASRLPNLFRTYKGSPSSVGPSSRRRGYDRNLDSASAPQVSIWQVARATTANPTLFRPMIIDDPEYSNSGVGMSNPCLEIFREVQDMNVNRRNNNILNFGSGRNDIQSQDRKAKLSQCLTRTKYSTEWHSESEKVHHKVIPRSDSTCKQVLIR